MPSRVRNYLLVGASIKKQQVTSSSADMSNGKFGQVCPHLYLSIQRAEMGSGEATATWTPGSSLKGLCEELNEWGWFSYIAKYSVF